MLEVGTTPPEFDIHPGKLPSQQEICLPNIILRGELLIFRGVPLHPIPWDFHNLRFHVTKRDFGELV